MKIHSLYLLLFLMIVLVAFTVAPVETPTRKDVINTPWQDYQGVVQV